MKAQNSTLNLLSDFDWEIIQSSNGAKQAFLQLRDIKSIETPASTSVKNLLESKRYQIMETYHHQSEGELLDTFIRINLEGLRGKTIPCLLIGDEGYCFFWRQEKS